MKKVKVTTQQGVDNFSHGEHHPAELDESSPEVEGASLNRALVGTGLEQGPFEVFDLVVKGLDCVEIPVDQIVEQTVEEKRDTVLG